VSAVGLREAEGRRVQRVVRTEYAAREWTAPNPQLQTEPDHAPSYASSSRLQTPDSRPNPTGCSFRWFIVAESTVRWFVVREKHCWMAANSADKLKRTRHKLLALPTAHIPLFLHSGECGRATYIIALDRYCISQKLKPRYEAETTMHALLSFWPYVNVHA
jgi:hypothetical protein